MYFYGEEIAIQKIYINKIAEIKNLEIQYIEECRSQVLNKYNSEQQYKEYYDLYTSIL